ncbi:MAG: biotin--[acetyl-CoA-carboxylase] ligase, partial [Clostridiales bacterium]|nr:biotin--[acetyl-CoA-carboxylase] ligase [Clostridiales bacterium]
MKEKILKLLRDEEKYISGEEMSSILRVSRTAIWKHIKVLKQQGYKIESKSGYGYHLIDGKEHVNKEELKIIIHQLGNFFTSAEYFDQIDSTNIYAKNLKHRENTLIVANEQLSGRGRLGRDWKSDGGQGIYMSLKIHPDLMPSEAINMTQIMALAIVRALRELYNVNVLIKWPNDIVFEGKKLAGILTEMSTEINQIYQLIIGIGININQDSFTDELKDKAISLKQITDKEILKLQLIKQILFEFIELHNEFIIYRNLEFVIDDINNYSSVVGEEIIAFDKGKTYNYTVEYIDKDGRL